MYHLLVSSTRNYSMNHTQNTNEIQILFLLHKSLDYYVSLHLNFKYSSCFKAMLLKVLILLSLHKCHAQLNEFGIDYYGEQISVEEYENSSICLTYTCFKDAKRFMNSAPHKYIPDPCEDFDDFICGHFYEFEAPNDRYYVTGFNNEIGRQNQHYQKLMLRKKIHKDEPKIFQIMKSY